MALRAAARTLCRSAVAARPGVVSLPRHAVSCLRPVQLTVGRVPLLGARCFSVESTSSEAEAAKPEPAQSVQDFQTGEEDEPRRRYAFARAINIRVSPKKLNYVCQLIRFMGLEEALVQLQASPKKIARTVRSCLYDAKFNAKNNHGLNTDNLVVAECWVGKGEFLRRIRYHSKGRFGIMHHGYSNLNIKVLELDYNPNGRNNRDIFKLKPKWIVPPLYPPPVPTEKRTAQKRKVVLRNWADAAPMPWGNSGEGIPGPGAPKPRPKNPRNPFFGTEED